MSHAATTRRTTARRHRLALIIACVVTAWALAWTWTAVAATTDNVTVTSTVGSVLSVQDSCSSAFAITVVLSSTQSDTCGFQFGSSNDSTTTLRMSSSAGALLAGGVFADHVGGCGALSGDTAGVKVSSVGAGVTSSLGCTVSTAATNADYLAVPDAFTNTCSGTNAGVTANSCELAVGVTETGGNATAGSYVGTINVDVIG